MSAGFEPGSDDGIHAGLLKCCSLIGCGRRANSDNVFRPALFQDFLWWDSVDEAEHWNVRVQQHASLIFESRRQRIWFICWKRRSQLREMLDNRSKATVECAFVRPSRASSSCDTHRFIAKGFEVRERISAITSLMASGERLSAPNDPSPPKLETAAVNFCDDNPPRGP